jgi:hypothetical protein
MKTAMGDLFDLFPDLPWFPRRSSYQGVLDVQLRAEAARRRMVVSVAQRKRVAGLVRAAWRRRMTAGS